MLTSLVAREMPLLENPKSLLIKSGWRVTIGPLTGTRMGVESGNMETCLSSREGNQRRLKLSIAAMQSPWCFWQHLLRSRWASWNARKTWMRPPTVKRVFLLTSREHRILWNSTVGKVLGTCSGQRDGWKCPTPQPSWNFKEVFYDSVSTLFLLLR